MGISAPPRRGGGRALMVASYAGALLAAAAACGGGALLTLGEAGPGVPAPKGAPASVVAATPTSQNGRVGEPVPVLPTVRVLDDSGAPLSGIPVRFAVTAGGGSLTTGGGGGSSEVSTDGRGEASAEWTLGPRAGVGNQVLRAEVPGLAPVVFTATAEPGPPARLEVSGGDGQQGLVTAALPVPPEVVVVDGFGNPVPGTPVLFAAADGYVMPARVVTDASGRASTSWILGPAAGEQRMTASLPGRQGGAAGFRAAATGAATLCGLPDPSPGFDVDVCALGELGATAGQAVEAAVGRWEAVIVGDLADTDPDPAHASCVEGAPWIGGTVDDLVLYVEVARIDGPGGGLAGAAPCFVRGEGGLPSVARLRIDEADVAPLAAAGRLVDVLTHEIGHALGFGTLWPGSGYLRDPVAGAGPGPPPDTHFGGPAAVAAFAAAGGATTGSPVPVQNTGGQGIADLHWRESVLGSELMTATLDDGVSNPLSAITVASLADLGYVVDASAADDYVISSPPARSPAFRGRAPRRTR